MAKLLLFGFCCSKRKELVTLEGSNFYLRNWPLTTLVDPCYLRIAPCEVVEFDPLCIAPDLEFYLEWSAVPLCLYPPPDDPVVVKGL